MIDELEFPYAVSDHEAEKASNSYLMSLMVIIMGLPLPILNLIATLAFYISNRKGTYFVRWHCTQALLSQLSIFFVNSIGFWWTISIIFGDKILANDYIAYMMIVFALNFIEFIVTIYTAINTRKGKHIVWWFYGDLAYLICKTSI